jgi:hypothetical protein
MYTHSEQLHPAEAETVCSRLGALDVIKREVAFAEIQVLNEEQQRSMVVSRHHRP